MPFRPWADLDSMNEGLINNFNSVVSKDDTVIMLGDIIMGKKFENVPKYLPRLNGTKILVNGNHDWLPFEQRPDKIKQFEDLYLSNGITQIVYGCARLSMLTFEPEHDEIKICHFPTADTIDTRDNEYEQRYTSLRPKISDGEILFHGHTHSKNRITSPGIYHVGCDAWDYKPVSLETLLALRN